ncbi:hypothetical protein KW468_14495, partial [Vibrio fluvialis]|nr:hypothetical protein [Vibrio fluvialis]
MSDLSAAAYNAIHQLKVNEIAQLLSLNGDQVTKLDQIISAISSTQSSVIVGQGIFLPESMNQIELNGASYLKSGVTIQRELYPTFPENLLLNKNSYSLVDIGFSTSSVFCCAAYGENAIAVGASGKIAYSSDSGQTWTLATSPFGTSAIRSVSLYGTNSVAVGDAGKIAYSSDSGQTWTLTTSPFGTSAIRSVSLYGTNSVAVGDAGKIAYSSDSGQ